ncbi:hypothetical protein KCG48_05685 [Proteiniclasticum sp. BAD-10]|uniref:Uncharacterized protein n=1 Tax=Proteiniclasticum sediminis TaxID=2804028 RepID=A0A941HR42_9CLOT|nr:hypothetical protein [Proteiniclasticum sediminis]MBR0575832.1 hypothetical protein [Proteiniclasticum sediminis]
MNKDNILQYLENNGLSDIDILKEEEGLIVATAYYDFDGDELDAAKAYADDQVEEDDSEEVYNEFFNNYLVDLAVDNLGEVMEELIEEEGIDAQYLTYELDPEEVESLQVAMLFSSGDTDNDLEDILDELEM